MDNFNIFCCLLICLRKSGYRLLRHTELRFMVLHSLKFIGIKFDYTMLNCDQFLFQSFYLIVLFYFRYIQRACHDPILIQQVALDKLLKYIGDQALVWRLLKQWYLVNCFFLVMPFLIELVGKKSQGDALYFINY